MKRLIVYSLLIAFGYYILGPYDYDCYKCHAKRFRFSEAIGYRGISKKIEKILGEQCVHDWELNSSCLGLADRFSRRFIPLAHCRNLNQLLEIVPNDQLKKKIILSLTTRENKLSWVVADIFKYLKPNEFESLKADSKKYFTRYEFIFEIETDLHSAQEKTEKVKSLLKEDFPNNFWFDERIKIRR